MKLVYSGKTKDVYDNEDSFCLVFSDRVTKNAAGEVDPGGNAIADITVQGQGRSCVTMSATIFSALEEKNITKTHMMAYDLDKLTMTVQKAQLFTPGIEWIGRWVCTGSFFRRYNMIPGVIEGMPLATPVFEITLKDDTAGDPLIAPSAVVGLGIADATVMDALLDANTRTLHAIHTMFAERGLDLWDIKIEWGLDANSKPLLIDEVSPGSCRAYKAGTKERVVGSALAELFS